MIPNLLKLYQAKDKFDVEDIRSVLIYKLIYVTKMKLVSNYYWS